MITSKSADKESYMIKVKNEISSILSNATTEEDIINGIKSLQYDKTLVDRKQVVAYLKHKGIKATLKDGDTKTYTAVKSINQTTLTHAIKKHTIVPDTQQETKLLNKTADTDKAVGGDGDLLNENDLNYQLKPKPVEVSVYEGIPETKMPLYNRDIASSSDDAFGSDTTEFKSGGAGESPEDIAHRDYMNKFLEYETKYGSYDKEILPEGFEEVKFGTETTDEIKSIRQHNFDKQQGIQSKQPKLNLVSTTKSLRQTQDEEKGVSRSRSGRQNQVNLVRQSELNHLRSIYELMPSM